MFNENLYRTKYLKYGLKKDSNTYFKNKYLKYKNKYLSLKSQIGGDEFTIIIYEHKFTLLAKGVHRHREVVLIKSSNKDDSDEIYFMVYRSQSEMGCWRFCSHSFQNFKDMFYKGWDYVTHTFIHIELQTFININFHLIPHHNIDPKITQTIFENTKELLELSFEWEKIEESFINLNKEISNDIYKTLNDVYFGNVYIRSLLNDISKNDYDYLNAINIADCGSKETDYIKLYDDYPPMQTIIPKYIPKFLEKYEENKLIRSRRQFIRRYNESETHFEYFENEKESIEAMYNIINDYLSTIMTIDEKSLKFMYVLPLKFDNAEFILNVYTIDVKIKDDLFTLVCGKYLMKTKTDEKTYTCVINLIPKTSKITKIGLNSEIVSIGIYLCKIMDYLKQLQYFPGSIFQIDKNYGFIGKYSDNVFPLNIIKFPDLILPKATVETTDICTPSSFTFLAGKIDKLKTDIFKIDNNFKFYNIELNNLLKIIEEKEDLNKLYTIVTTISNPKEIHDLKDKLLKLLDDSEQVELEYVNEIMFLQGIFYLFEKNKIKIDKQIFNNLVNQLIHEISKY